MTKTIDQEQIKSSVAELGEQYGAENIYLFGSYARGTANENSDIDLRIDKGKIHGLIQLASLQIALEEKLGVKVDLLTSDSLSESFLNKISTEEVLLYGSKILRGA